MRECGGCTLCCKIPSIPVINKRSDRWCVHCSINQGCKVYQHRPQPCADFRCLWLDSGEIKEEYRPDRVHFYISGNLSDEVLKVRVDTDFPEAWKHVAVDDLVKDNHLLIVVGRQVTFMPAINRPMPEKIALEWTL